MFKILTVSGALPQTPRGSLRRSPDLLAVRGFLPSSITASRLRRLQFPHGLKSSSVKERWPMRLGGICARGLGGIDAPGGRILIFQLAYFLVLLICRMAYNNFVTICCTSRGLWASVGILRGEGEIFFYWGDLKFMTPLTRRLAKVLKTKIELLLQYFNMPYVLRSFWLFHSQILLKTKTINRP